MKKNFLLAKLILIGLCVSLFSCNDDSDSNFEKYGKYGNGVFILNEGNMTTENGVVSFIDSKGNITDSVFMKENPGSDLGNVPQDMWIANGKIYFVSQNGPNYITITDAITMKKETEITDGFAKSDWPTHIVVCNETKAYVRSNLGIHILDLKTNEITGTIESTEKANKQKMELINNRAIIPASDTLLIIDPETDKIEKKIGMGGSITGIIEGKDKCIWAAVYGDVSEFIKVETFDFEIEQRDTLPNKKALRAGWIPSIGLCASLIDNSLYWRSGAVVYKHTTEGDIHTEVFVDFKTSYTDANIIYGDINIDPGTNELFVSVIKGYGWDFLINGIYVFDCQSGKQSRSIYKNHTRFSAGIFSTESFRY